MANILFGGPQEKEREYASNIHDDLIERLSKEHKVDYITRGDQMLGALSIHTINRSRIEVGLEGAVYDLVIYDSGLFFDQAEPDRRAELFVEMVINYLKLAQAPVIILADPEIANRIREPTQKAGFTAVDQPYNIDKVVEAVNREIQGWSEVDLDISPLVYREALRLIEPKYKTGFRKFIQTGEAGQEMLDYLDNDPNAQKAVDIILQVQARAFEDLGRRLSGEFLDNKIKNKLS